MTSNLIARTPRKVFFSLQYPPFTIEGLTYHVHENGKFRVGFPSAPKIKSDGTAEQGDDGKVVCYPVMQILDKDHLQRFQRALVKKLAEIEHRVVAASKTESEIIPF